MDHPGANAFELFGIALMDESEEGGSADRRFWYGDQSYVRKDGGVGESCAAEGYDGACKTLRVE